MILLRDTERELGREKRARERKKRVHKLEKEWVR